MTPFSFSKHDDADARHQGLAKQRGAGLRGKHRQSPSLEQLKEVLDLQSGLAKGHRAQGTRQGSEDSQRHSRVCFPRLRQAAKGHRPRRTPEYCQGLCGVCGWGAVVVSVRGVVRSQRQQQSNKDKRGAA